MDEFEQLSLQLTNLSSFVMTQLSEKNLRPLIETAVAETLAIHIQSYLNSHIEACIQSLIQQEISKITEKYHEAMINILGTHSKNIEILKSIQFHITEKLRPESSDKVIEAIEKKNFTNVLQYLMEIQDDDTRSGYINCIDPAQIDLSNVSEEMAHRTALWIINNNYTKIRCVPILERICQILPKSDKLSEVLRKIVTKADPILSVSRSIILKKII